MEGKTRMSSHGTCFCLQVGLEVWIWPVPRDQLGGPGGGSFRCHRSQGTVGARFPGCEWVWRFPRFLSVTAPYTEALSGRAHFSVLLNKQNGRILLLFLSLCDFSRVCRAFTEASWQRIIEEREMCKGLPTDKLQRLQLSAHFSPLLCLQVGPLNCKKTYFSCF